MAVFMKFFPTRGYARSQGSVRIHRARARMAHLFCFRPEDFKKSCGDAAGTIPDPSLHGAREREVVHVPLPGRTPGRICRLDRRRDRSPSIHRLRGMPVVPAAPPAADDVSRPRKHGVAWRGLGDAPGIPVARIPGIVVRDRAACRIPHQDSRVVVLDLADKDAAAGQGFAEDAEFAPSTVLSRTAIPPSAAMANRLS